MGEGGTFELTEIAFANHILAIPPGLNGYETLTPMTARGSNIVVEVKAALDRASRRFTLRLRALDPATGWFSEDPLVGLLYLTTNRQPEVLLYGLPGRSFIVQTVTNLDAPIAWRVFGQFTMTNLWQVVSGIVATNRTSFFRAVAAEHLFDRLTLAYDVTNRTAALTVLRAQPAHTLILEASENLQTWTPLATKAPAAVTDWGYLDASAASREHRFYRVRPLP